MRRFSSSDRRRELIGGSLLLTGLFSLVLAFFTVAILTWAAFTAKDMLSYHEFTSSTEGVVASQSGGKSCSARVNFSVDGELHESRYDGCPGVGSSVTVVYDPSDPLRSSANGEVRTYVTSPLFLLFSLAMSFIFTRLSANGVRLLLGRPVKPI